MVFSSSQVTRLLECLSYGMADLPEATSTLDFVKDAVQQALCIYKDEIVRNSHLSNTDEADVNARVQHFIETLEDHSWTPCDQVLVWANFIVASSSVLGEHRRYFERLFSEHHVKSGFRHVLLAPGLLRMIWARSSSVSWTSMLAQTRILVM